MSIQDIREKIELMPNTELKIIAKFQLQTACRLSEAVGKYAIRKEDLSFANYKGHDLALFTLRTAKRNGVPRIVALPYSQVWVNELVDHFKNSKRRVFGYGDSSVRHLLSEQFAELKYFIERYSPEKGKVIQAHDRNVCTHALRHLRLSELVNAYGFDEIDLATFAGWKMKGMASRYVTSAWGRYIDKLLKE
jgi:integrase